MTGRRAGASIEVSPALAEEADGADAAAVPVAVAGVVVGFACRAEAVRPAASMMPARPLTIKTKSRGTHACVAGPGAGQSPRNCRAP